MLLIEYAIKAELAHRELVGMHATYLDMVAKAAAENGGVAPTANSPEIQEYVTRMLEQKSVEEECFRTFKQRCEWAGVNSTIRKQIKALAEEYVSISGGH